VKFITVISLKTEYFYYVVPILQRILDETERFPKKFGTKIAIDLSNELGLEIALDLMAKWPI